MSINFHANASETTTEKAAPCLCSQMAESWMAAMDGDFSDAVKADLKAEANPACPFCKGTGVEMEVESDAPTFNVTNESAELLFGALGLQMSFVGDMTVPEARRAIMRARSRSDLSPFTSEPETVYGAPRTHEDGTVELRPVRVSGPGVDEDRMASYITRFANFVEAAAARGATTIHWD